MVTTLRYSAVNRIIAVVLLCWIAAVPAAFAVDSESDIQTRAAIVFKLTRFVNWPESSFSRGDAPITICLLGNTPIAAPLQRVSGVKIQGHAALLRSLDKLDEQALTDCHLLYLARGMEDKLRYVLAITSTKPVLTVSDIDAFAERGGIIGLTQRASRYGFRINLESARQAGLGIHTPLLEVSEVIGNWRKDR